MCNSEQDSECWQGLYNNCREVNLGIDNESLKKLVTYKKWVETVIQKENEDKELDGR